MANQTHEFDEIVYECDCGAWWVGETGATGTLADQPTQECQRCGAMVTPTIQAVE